MDVAVPVRPPLSTLKGLPDFAFHSRAVLPSLPEANSSPSLSKATGWTAPPCPSGRRTRLPGPAGRGACSGRLRPRAPRRRERKPRAGACRRPTRCAGRGRVPAGPRRGQLVRRPGRDAARPRGLRQPRGIPRRRRRRARGERSWTSRRGPRGPRHHVVTAASGTRLVCLRTPGRYRTSRAPRIASFRRRQGDRRVGADLARPHGPVGERKASGRPLK